MKQARLILLAWGVLFISITFSLVSTAQNNPVTIRMWHIATDTDPFRPVLQGAVDRFNAAHTDIHIDAQAIPNDAFKGQLEQAVAANNVPDVFQTWGGGLLETYVRLGVAREIPELSGQTGAQFAPASLAYSTFNGKHYAIPANLAGVFLWYNEELFDQHQLAPPTTWAQLIDTCKAFRGAGIVPVALGNKDRWPGAFWYDYLALRIGGPQTGITQASSVNTATFQRPEYVEAGRHIQEAVNAGCFEDNFSDQDFGMAQRLLGTGAAAMQLQGDWNLGGLRNVDFTRTQNAIRVMPFPTVEGGQGDASTVLGSTGQAFAISAKAPPQTASALLEMFASADYGNAVAASGFIPALSGYDQYITDPLVRQMSTALLSASQVQLYYDQLLPPALAQIHLATTQDLFNRSISPEEAAQQMANAAGREAAVSDTAASSLRALAEARGIQVGSAVNVGALRSEPQYAQTLRQQFNVVTPETAMKMEIIHPARDRYNFKDADYLVQFAQANNMQVHGHTLVWYRQLPAWLTNGHFSRDEMLSILRDHIQTIVGRYRGKIAAWDVVNEAVDENGAMRNNIWLQTIGPEYIDYAFQWAQEADPDALLFYNDYDTEGLGPKSDAVYNLVQGLVGRGIPIHGVGFQMHTSIGKPPRIDNVAANMSRLAALHLQIQITEMDVQLQDGQGAQAQRLEQQAQIYADVARACLATPACTAFITWGFTDQHTWIPEYTGHADAPLPFDTAYRPKPAYQALLLAFLNG
jgi:endo-1,4-beta-xylanase